jgi:uncharacterized protein (TIGR02757 family)
MERSELLRELAQKHNHRKYFEQDPIIFPRHFSGLLSQGKATLQDVEIAAVISAHLAWGRRDMIVRDCRRAFDQMEWRPYEYVVGGSYKDDNVSLHRTIKWSDFAQICTRLRNFYQENSSLEILSPDQMRTQIYGQKSDLKATNKKIHMLRRWMVRNDGIVDLGLWKGISPKDLIIPLDVHVFNSAVKLGITTRKSPDYKAAQEITEYLLTVFPDDPLLGDFALFVYDME